MYEHHNDIEAEQRHVERGTKIVSQAEINAAFLAKIKVYERASEKNGEEIGFNGHLVANADVLAKAEKTKLLWTMR